MNLSELLEPIAAQFRAMGIPEPITHWGHPLMMGIVVVVMGSFAGITGWRGRLLMQTEPDAAIKNRSDHSKIAPLMFLFMALGYTGGLLSLVIQQHNVLESPHFWTGSLVLILLGLNGLISATGFGGNQAALRTAHAYLGSLALVVMLVHAILGLQLGFSI